MFEEGTIRAGMKRELHKILRLNLVKNARKHKELNPTSADVSASLVKRSHKEKTHSLSFRQDSLGISFGHSRGKNSPRLSTSFNTHRDLAPPKINPTAVQTSNTVHAHLAKYSKLPKNYHLKSSSKVTRHKTENTAHTEVSQHSEQNIKMEDGYGQLPSPLIPGLGQRYGIDEVGYDGVRGPETVTSYNDNDRSDISPGQSSRLPSLNRGTSIVLSPLGMKGSSEQFDFANARSLKLQSSGNNLENSGYDIGPSETLDHPKNQNTASKPSAKGDPQDDFPVELPSNLLNDPRFDSQQRPAQYMKEYADRLQYFIHEVFVRDRCLMNCLRTGKKYQPPTEEQKQRMLIDLYYFDEEDHRVPMIYDTSVGTEWNYYKYKLDEKKPKPNKWVEIADKEYGELAPFVDNAVKYTDRVISEFKFDNDNTEGPKHKNLILPSEVDKIESFYNKLNKNYRITEADLDAVIAISARIAFFEKLDKETQISIIKGASFRRANTGDYIFRKGDQGNSMFVILAGSAKVLLTKFNEKKQVNEEHAVTTLTDGKTFGEYTLLNFNTGSSNNSSLGQELFGLKSTLCHKGFEMILEAQRLPFLKDETEEERQRRIFKYVVDNMMPEAKPHTRSASILIQEPTYLLEVPAEVFQSSIVNKIKTEAINKARLLASQIYFANHQSLNFIPIAMMMSKKEFKLGEIILKKGETPSALVIIKEGFCEAVYITKRMRPIVKDILKPSHRPPLRSFIIDGKNGSHSVDIRKIRQKKAAEEAIQVEQLIEQRRKVPEKRLFPFDRVIKDTVHPSFLQQEQSIFPRLIETSNSATTSTAHAANTEEYYDIQTIKRLGPGDSLFTRCLLSNYVSSDGFLLSPQISNIAPAQLTIIASSVHVECYLLPRSLVPQIPEPAKTIMLSELQRVTDCDIGFNREEIDKMEQWDDYKSKLYVEQMIIRQGEKFRRDTFKRF